MNNIERGPTVSFDWDDTLFDGPYPIMDFIEVLESYFALGCRIIIITARRELFEHVREIEGLLVKYGIKNCVSKIIFTGHELKGVFAHREGVTLHIDDDIY